MYSLHCNDISMMWDTSIWLDDSIAFWRMDSLTYRYVVHDVFGPWTDRLEWQKRHHEWFRYCSGKMHRNCYYIAPRKLSMHIAMYNDTSDANHCMQIVAIIDSRWSRVSSNYSAMSDRDWWWKPWWFICWSSQNSHQGWIDKVHGISRNHWMIAHGNTCT